jgi:hypothetical protein
MTEAQSMAGSSVESGLQVGKDDEMDNSKLLLFPRAEAKHYEEVVGTYATMGWEDFEVYSLIIRKLFHRGKSAVLGF